MDTLVFDIETQNFFTDPEVGWDNFEALKISVVGVYSYDRDEYLVFKESEMLALAELFAKAGRIEGFSMNRFPYSTIISKNWESLPTGVSRRICGRWNALICWTRLNWSCEGVSA